MFNSSGGKDGFPEIQNKDEKYNYVKTDGTLLSTEWFNFAEDFIEGLAKIQNKYTQTLYRC